MNSDPRCSLAVKVCAVFLAALLAVGTIFCAFGVFYLWSGGAYDGAGDFFNTAVFNRLSWNEAELLYSYAVNAPDEAWAEAYAETSATGFSVTRDADGAVLASGNRPADPVYTHDYGFEGLTVTLSFAKEPLRVDGYSYARLLYDRLLPVRNLLCWLLGLFVLAGAVVTVFLCCAAGHRRGEEHVLPNYLDRVPLDLWLALAIFLGMGCLAPVDQIRWSGGFSLPFLLLCGAGLLGLCLLLLATLLTLATRVKMGRWWRNTVIFKTLRLLGRMVRGVWRALADTAHALPLTWATALLFCGFALLQTILTLLSPENGFGFLLLLALDLAALYFACRVTLSLKRLREGGARLAAGDADFRIDVRKMPRPLREHGEHLNSLGDGIGLAVERQLKSERMKTELITNVSHDIKTPLTSILNYVDLLQKDPTPEQRTEYLAVLDRQARRLKKLTEDLVEASKAATGNMQVQLERTDLGELLRQAAGEYEERWGKNTLTPVLTVPEEPLPILADGRLLWRVLDNLLGNACKYAQPGTRVYLDARRIGDDAVFTVRNISRLQLNVDPDELMERFVRGDGARTTEGSGLGLNIARSLTELQHGTLTLAIDGDLFKATACFPLTA